MAEEIKYLDYEGLKTLVASVLNEIPIPDERTIKRNSDGTISALTQYTTPEVGTDGMLVFKDSPMEVNNGTLIFN